MAQSVSKTEERGAARAAKFVDRLLRDVSPRDFAVELWDGTRFNPDRHQFCRFTWKINNPDALTNVFRSSNRQLALGEAYIHSDFDLIGDIEAAFRLADHVMSKKWTFAEKIFFSSFFGARPFLVRSRNGLHLRAAHSKKRDREAIQYHYDVSNEFYQLWLDSNMLYSCAYFEDESDDLCTAQVQKLDLICSRLQLKPGERLIDIGCGWGGLIMHAARNYGVEAAGITISDAQADLAQERIRAAGLQDVCGVYRMDYRDLDDVGPCDKLVSVGMIEHVGKERLQDYFSRAFEVLRPGGLFLNSGIGTEAKYPESKYATFTDVYVFPDAELVPIATTLAGAEEAGFEVRTIENMREHYELTTRKWLHRLEAGAAKARELVGEERYRIWRLYLAGSADYFRKGWLGMYQTLLYKADANDSSSPW